MRGSNIFARGEIVMQKERIRYELLFDPESRKIHLPALRMSVILNHPGVK